MRKPILIGGLAIVAAIILVMASATEVLFNIDAEIKDGITESASRAFKVDVTVAQSQMSLKTGEAQLIGVHIPNPPGFSMTDAIELPQIDVVVDTSRQAGRAVAVSSVVIERPRIVLELVDGKANLVRLRDSARAFARRAEDPEQSAAGGQRLMIDRITLQNGSLVITADFLGSDSVDIPLPDSRVTDIGIEAGGVPPAAIVAAITDLIMTATERAARRVDLAAEAAKNGMSAPDIDLSTLLTE